MAWGKAVLSRHYGLAQCALAAAGVEAYELLRGALKPNWPVALAHARDVAALERFAHVGWEASLQRPFLELPALVQLLNVFYVAGHFALTAVFFVWLYRRSRPAFQLFRNAFLVATAIAFVVVWQFPTAPPRLAHVGLVDTLRRFSDIDIGSRASSPFSDPVAAVPSLHAGWALGVGVGLVLYARPLGWRIAGALYPLVVVVTIVVTGNHFVFDALAGMAVMAAGFGAALASERRSTGRIAAATRGGAVR